MRKFKAVIIDDEKWTRQVIRSLGEWDRYGIAIEGEASDGEYGLELIRQVKPDIILTDVCMPHINGLEQIERIRQDNEDVQVIFISGYDDYNYVRNAMKLGAVDYLLKPLKPEELNRQLEVCIHKLENLKKEKKSDDFSMGFLNEEWAGEYYRYRDGLSETLSSWNTVLLKEKLEQLGAFLACRIEKEHNKGNMISIYFSLLNILQRFIISFGYSMEDVFVNKNTTFVFSEDCSVEKMLDYISTLYLETMERVHEKIKGRNRLDIAQIETYLQEHYMDGISLEETAEDFFVSKEYLSKIFKQETGKGFSEYLTGLRMEKAKELIVEYKIPIKDVSERVGYIDQAHFYKTFKKYFNMTPGEMKQV